MKIIGIGSSALMDGFALLGIQTYADESHEVIDQVLKELNRNNERALVFIQQDLMNAEIPMVSHLRNRGGSILLCAIPHLDQPQNYQPEVEQLIGRVMGQSILENTREH